MFGIIDRITSAASRRFDRDYQNLKRLSLQDRYTPGRVGLGGMSFDFPDARSFVFSYREIFQKRIYDFKTSVPRPYIIDCGANIGLSVIFFRRICPDADVLAFEPERRIFGYLKGNLEKNGIGGVELVQKAVWKEITSLSFINEGADANRIQQNSGDAQEANTYPVETVRLSEYLDREVDFLKIDIEGAETEVMREIAPRLHMVKRLFIEYHYLSMGVQELSDILGILERSGFSYYIDVPNPSRVRPYLEESIGGFGSFDSFLNIYAFRPQA